MPDFYPDIYDYLDGLQNSKYVSAKGLDEMVARIRARTGLSYDICEEIVKHFFQEIRNAMLRGECVSIRGFGKLHIASPRTGSKRKIFAKFNPHNTLLNNINGS